MTQGLTGTQQQALPSGTIVDYARIVQDDMLAAIEAISGGKCVGISSGGFAIIAMAGKSGRIPAIGYTPNNYASGALVSVTLIGKMFATSGLINLSGAAKDVFLGRSGEASVLSLEASGMVIGSGEFNVDQVIGQAISNSGFFVDMHQRVFGIAQGEFNIPIPIPVPFYASESGAIGCAIQMVSGSIVRLAQASISGRMPAVGVAPSGLTSGQGIIVYQRGVCTGSLASGARLGEKVYVGRLGTIDVLSGGTLSGGFLSGDVIQPIGTVMSSGKYLYDVSPITSSGLFPGM